VDNLFFKPIFPSIWSGLRPSPKISVADHAVQHYYLPREGNPFPGHFDIKKTPYLKKIMECLQFDNSYEEIVFAKGCQLGGTSVSLCFLLWIANGGHSAPALIVMPTEKNSQRFVKKKFRPAVKNCKDLMSKLQDRSLDRESLELFSFPGGTFSFGHARAPNTLRMDSCSVVICDEVSDFPPENGQGDPVEIARGRTNAYEGRRKIYLVSTPSNDGSCRITKALEATAKEKYFVPCPSCGEFQTIEWKRIKWNPGPLDVHLECGHCKAKIYEYQKPWLLERGEWRATVPEKISKKVIGFHLSALYSPLGMLSWASVVEQFLKSKDDPVQLKVFINNILGEAWKEGIGVSKNKLKKNTSDYRVEPLPQGVGLITAGVDINGSFSAIEIVGWGKDKESWGLAYHRIDGEASDPRLWEEIDRYLSQVFTHHKGYKIGISATAIDSGYMCDEVYNFVRAHMGSGRNIIAVKGIPGNGKPVISTKANYHNKASMPVFYVSNDTSNEVLYAYLNLPKPGPGYCHFPRFYSKIHYFDELTAMSKVTEYKKGKAYVRWIQDVSKRCEANDCRRYAMAAMFHLGVLGADVNDVVDELERMDDE
jgi:phage terminase large subunit GpA-like protein